MLFCRTRPYKLFGGSCAQCTTCKASLTNELSLVIMQNFFKSICQIFLAKYIQKWKHCLTNAYFVECALKCVWNILSVMIWDMKLWFHLNIQNWCVNWDGSSKVYQTLSIIQLCYMNLYFTFENKVALEKKMENIWFIFLHFQVPQRKLGKELEKGSSGKKQPRPSVLFSF